MIGRCLVVYTSTYISIMSTNMCERCVDEIEREREREGVKDSPIQVLKSAPSVYPAEHEHT